MRLFQNPNHSTQTRKILAAALFCLLVLPPGISAKTLAEYGAGLKSAAAAARELITYVDETAEDEDLRDAAYEREMLAAMRESLPASERLEWEGATIETGNQWFEAKLKAFEGENDWAKRRAILTEISARLAALENKLDELTGGAGSGRSKDEYKSKLSEILRRAEYQKPDAKQESWFERAQRKVREWFNEKFPQPDIPEGAGENLQSISFGLQIVLYALVLGFIAFLIYRFAPLFARNFRRGGREEKGERVILGEALARDENAQTLFDEAEALARSGNLRGAIRKGYIALLCELSDRRLIGLAVHKTNRDYLRDVRKRQKLYQNVNGLTKSFERHWYGFQTADETDWREFRENYRRAMDNVD